MQSALYTGHVVHVRHRPRQHKLRYRVFSILLDLDEVDRLDAKLRLFAHNRFAIFSFRDEDHGNGSRGGLRAWVNTHLESAGIDSAGTSVRILCYPRIFGYVFNPLTVYFCHSADGRLEAILYEVGNTFGERHTYVMATSGKSGTVRQRCAKELYVSPFVPMDCAYDFRIDPPGDAVLVNINETDAGGPLLFASFAGKRRPMSDRTLLAALFSYPLMTFKVTAGIHFEALRLWLKKVPVYRHSAAQMPIASTIIPYTPPTGKSES
ncbi:MAG: DUF1365 domain-containing protein [Allorhizobium sp.]